MNKRGASGDLIAMVLLIGLVVAIAAIMLSWGAQYLFEQKEETEEIIEDTLLYLEGVKIKAKVFNSPRKIDVENQGSLDIIGIVARGFAPKKVYVASSFSNPPTLNIPGGKIEPFEIKQVTLNFVDFSQTGESWLDLDRVELIPFVANAKGQPTDVLLKKEKAYLVGNPDINFCDGADVDGDFDIDDEDTLAFLDCLEQQNMDPNGPIPENCEPFDFNNGIIDNSDADSFQGSDFDIFGDCLGTPPIGICEPADCNNDGRIDLFDFFCFSSWFGQTCDPGNNWCNGMDLDQNGNVNSYSRNCRIPCALPPNDVCEYYWGESYTNCPTDCLCGNNVCDPGENDPANPRYCTVDGC